MLLFMLDTDITSYIVKRSHPAVLKRLERTAPENVCISAITKAELLYGLEISPRPERDRIALESFFHWVQAVDFPEAAAKEYAEIRARLRRGGNMIGANDLFIAAHAKHLKLTLATNNVREFQRVKGLAVENWTKA